MHLLKRCNAFRRAFTLIELITVIAIIAILMGLLLPAVQVVRNTANRTRAKSDVLAIVSAVKGYYTDYGQYPPLTPAPTTDLTFAPAAISYSTYRNWVLMDVLRNVTDTGGAMTSGSSANPRGVVYLDVPNAQGATFPKGGIVSGSSGTLFTGSTTVYTGDFVDPWGLGYCVTVDYNYDNVITATPWTDVTSVRNGVIAFSLGLDGQIGTKGNKILNATATAPASDDVVSFQ